MIKTYGRGSEWRRWDLHIHTPGTALNDQFGSWEEYLTAIEAGDPQIAVIGITDYLTLRGYKKLLAYRHEGRLKNITLVIPNIEFRIIPVTKDGKAINIHLLVSPDDPEHVARVEEALANLTISRGDDKISCTEESLRRFGYALRPELKSDPDAAYREGVNQFKIGFDSFQEWWHRQPWLKRNSLVAVANSSFDGASGIQHDSGMRSTRAEIYRFSHIIFSGRPGDREFFAGHSEHGVVYDVSRPCLHGSDAHETAKLFCPDQNRYCWIKTDPTFEGLRQTLYEPEERVFIGEEPPRHFDPDGVIDSITLRNTNGWFEERVIPINSGLVAIIGLKGSGKTAFADMLAFAAGSPTDPDESFIRRASEHLGGMELELTWASGLSDNATLPNSPGGLWGNGVKYLSQKFVERLCSGDQLSDELLGEVEEVIFAHIPAEDRFGAGDFQELRDVRAGALRERREEIAGLISTLSREIAALDQKRQEIRAKAKRQQELARAIEGLQKSRPKLTAGADEKHLKELGAARAEREKLTVAIAQRQRLKQTIEDLKKKLAAKYQETSAFWQSMQLQLAAAGFDPEEIQRLEQQTPSGWEAVVQRKLDLLQQAVGKLTGATPAAIPAQPATLAEWKAKVEALEKDIKLTDEKKRRIIDSQQQEEKLVAELEKIKKEVQWAAEGYPEERRQKRDEREKLYLEFFDLLKEEEAILYELYGPLRAALASQGAHEKKLELMCRVEVDMDTWVKRGEELFDLRKHGPIRETDLQAFAKDNLERAWRSCDKDSIRKGVQATLDLIKESEVLREQLRTGNTLVTLADWLFSVDHITMTYGIRYDDKDLKVLSPGTKGIVLLILYLAVDRGDHRPLIVDQPDENLDNQSVFEILRLYFREAKRRRQIIIITHNPNLVVNTDAEQIIIARSEVRASGLPRMTYSLGSLEAHTADGQVSGSIRDEICRILEGGREAFRMRERRYRDLESLPIEGRIHVQPLSGYQPLPEPERTAE
jgi:hypothetical protein